MSTSEDRLEKALNTVAAAIIADTTIRRMHRLMDQGWQPEDAARNAHNVAGEALIGAYRFITRPGVLLTEVEDAVASQRAPEARTAERLIATQESGRCPKCHQLLCVCVSQRVPIATPRRMLYYVSLIAHDEDSECASRGCIPAESL